MSESVAFTIVDTSGNTLHFDQFEYERSLDAARGEYFDANWLRCRITLQARIEPGNVETIFRQSVNATILTMELARLTDDLKMVLSAPVGAERTFEPMEPYIELQMERLEKVLLVTARLDLAPAVGPVIEFSYRCRLEEIEATLDGIETVRKAFPERMMS